MGREREQAILRGHLAHAFAGHGGLVLIRGEAGIGKTALAEAVCREATARGALVLIGRCYDLTETPPYGLWVDLFGRYDAVEGVPEPPPAFAARGGAAGSQIALFAAVRDFFAALAATSPAVVLLDDLHWADPASLDLLRSLARILARLPLLVIATYRADDITRRHPLYALVPLLVREAAANRVDLRPIEAADVRALLAPRYALPDADAERLVGYLHGRSEGNPFFLGELLHTLEAERVLHRRGDGWTLGKIAQTRVPLLLRQVIDGRLASLDPESQRLLAAAAVIGQDVPLAVWAAATDADEETLTAIVERGIDRHLVEATPDGASLRFVHALIREALYEGVGPMRRRGLHRRIADALVAAVAPDPDAVAYHYRQAGDARATEWLIRAGERAQRVYAWHTAVERYMEALAAMEIGDATARERGWLLYRLALLERFSDAPQGLSHLAEAAHLAERVHDRALAASVLLLKGLLHCFTEEIARGLVEMRMGQTALHASTGGRPEERDRFPIAAQTADEIDGTGQLVAWLAIAGHYAEARTLGERAVADADSAAAGYTGWEGRGDLYHGLGQVYAAMGLPEDGRRAYARAREEYLAGGDYLLVGGSAANELRWIHLPFRTEHIAERRRLSGEIVDAWKRASDVLGSDEPAEIALLPLLALEGNWSTARQLAATAPRRLRAVNNSVISPLAFLQGETALARKILRETLPDGPGTTPGSTRFFATQIFQRLAVALAIDEGDLPAARAWLVAHDRWIEWSHAVLGAVEGRILWAEYERAAGNAGQARLRATEALECARDPRQPLVLLVAHRLLGQLHVEARQYADAATHLAAALNLADTCAAPYERALTLLAQAELSAAGGDEAEALTLLDAVRGIGGSLGAAPALARADALAARLAGGLRPLSPSPGRLTNREVEVLRLIAAGRSNQEIATTLFISTRTVNRHIENLYRKIDAHGKAEATAYAFRHQLT